MVLARLWVDGPIIRDWKGQVFLAGVSYRGDSRGGCENYFDKAAQDAEKIKGWGFNCIKFPIAWKWFEPTSFGFDMDYLNTCVQAIKEFTSRGIYVVIHLESGDTERCRGNLRNFIPMSTTTWFFLDAFLTDTGPNGAREHIKEAFLRISDALKDDDGIVGYSIINNVHIDKITALSLQQQHDLWWNALDYLTSSLRGNGDNKIVFATGCPYEQTWIYMNRLLSDPNTAYDPHFYQGTKSGGVPSNYDLAWLRDKFSTGQCYIREKMLEFPNAPFLIGEFGVLGGDGPTTWDEPKSLWERNALAVFREQGRNMAGWLHFAYYNNSWSNYGLWDPIVRAIQESMVDKPTEVHTPISPMIQIQGPITAGLILLLGTL